MNLDATLLRTLYTCHLFASLFLCVYGADTDGVRIYCLSVNLPSCIPSCVFHSSITVSLLYKPCASHLPNEAVIAVKAPQFVYSSWAEVSLSLSLIHTNAHSHTHSVQFNLCLCSFPLTLTSQQWHWKALTLRGLTVLKDPLSDWLLSDQLPLLWLQ